MLKKILNIILSLVITMSLIFSPIAFAGDPMPAGTTLDEDSYVFTLEEAEALMYELQYLEEKNGVQEEINDTLTEQILEYEGLIELKDRRVQSALSLSTLHESRIKDLEKEKKFMTIKCVGLFALGAVFAGGSIYLGDRISDSIERSN